MNQSELNYIYDELATIKRQQQQILSLLERVAADFGLIPPPEEPIEEVQEPPKPKKRKRGKPTPYGVMSPRMKREWKKTYLDKMVKLHREGTSIHDILAYTGHGPEWYSVVHSMVRYHSSKKV